MKNINIPLIIIILLLSCTNQKKKQQPEDFKKSGFLNNDYFQVILKRPPDKTTDSLIDKRESAYFNAKKSIPEITITKLVEYCNSYSKKNNNNEKLRKKLHKYVSSGYIFKEYYTEKNEVILVYRIYKKGLKKEIESIAVSSK